jgi:sporulation protein YlmC with PRC-barrel domain
VDYHIGAPIFDRNGERLGSLKHVVVDPSTSQVADIVLGESGLLGRDVIVPVSSVGQAEPDRVDLTLDREQAHALEDFVTTSYQAPPPGMFAGSPWVSGALITDGIGPVGAASGIESIAYTPVVDTIEQIPPGDVDVAPGTEVWATDGKIGHVRDIVTEEQTGKIRGLVVEGGRFFSHKDYEVSLAQVAEIADDRVSLKMSKAELKR